MKGFLKILILVIFCLGNYSISMAQSSDITEGIDLKFTPANPEPNQIVKATISAYITDLTKSTISWYVNNTLIERGAGVRSIEFQTGDPGKTSVVRVLIVKQDGGTIEKTLTILPSEVDILIEAMTYVPPFYQGRALPTKQADYKFVAIPNLTTSSGQKIANDRIYYKWEINGTVDLSGSGVGKNYYFYTGKLIDRPVEITVEASSVNTDQKAKKTKTLNTVSPFALFYENSLVLGTLFENAAFGEARLNKQETEVRAVPFYFDRDTVSDLNYSWSVDGSTIENVAGNLISFRRVNGKEGSADIGVKIKSDDNLLQNAVASFRLIYSENNSFQF